MADRGDIPRARYIRAEYVIEVMGEFGAERLAGLDPLRVLALAMLGGGFITVGALFSVLLAAGAAAEGTVRLLEGIGFSTGFFFVVLSEAVLFTEANAVLPAALMRRRGHVAGIARFWALAWVGNFVGALAIGALIAVAQDYSAEVDGLLAEIVAAKMAYQAEGGVGSWFQVVVSGVLANWLVGMAAFFAMMGRTIVGKYIPVLLAVTAFVSANFQHSPANMGYFSLASQEGTGPGWLDALGWNILPAGIGNIVGGAVLVTLLLAWAFRPLAKHE